MTAKPICRFLFAVAIIAIVSLRPAATASIGRGVIPPLRASRCGRAPQGIGHGNGDTAMLVLVRKNECVVIGGHNPLERMLKVTVLGIDAGGVRLFFETVEDSPIPCYGVRERLFAGVGRHPAMPVAESVSEAQTAGGYALP